MILGDLEPVTLMSMKYTLTYSCQIQIEHLICWSSVRIMVMGCIELFVCESSWIPPDADIVLVSDADKFILSLGYEEMQGGAGTSG